MEELKAALINYPEESRYFYLTIISLLTSIGIMPTTTDILLICCGILCKMGVMDTPTTLSICIITMLIGESVVFTLGHKLGTKVFKFGLLNRVFPPKRRNRIQARLANNPLGVLRAIRLTPAMRPYVLFATASLGLKPRDFLKYHFRISLLYIPALFYLPFLIYQFVPVNNMTVLIILSFFFIVSLLMGRTKTSTDFLEANDDDPTLEEQPVTALNPSTAQRQEQ